MQELLEETSIHIWQIICVAISQTKKRDWKCWSKITMEHVEQSLKILYITKYSEWF